MTTTPPTKRRRHVFRWVFLAVQALFVVWAVGGAASGTHTSCAGLVDESLKTCQDASHAGTAIGVALIIFLWAAVDIILGIGWLILRRRG